jgi:hypothetical protein
MAAQAACRPLNADKRDRYMAKVRSLGSFVEHLVWVMGPDGKVHSAVVCGLYIVDSDTVTMDEHKGKVWWPYQ